MRTEALRGGMRPAIAWRSELFQAGALLALALASGAAIALGNGNPLVALVPAALALLVLAVWKTPLRGWVAGLLFLSLALEKSTDCQGEWHTALAIVGDVLAFNLDSVVPALRGFKLTGMEVLALVFIGVASARRLLGNTLDTRGQEASPGAMRQLVVLFGLAIAYGAVNGLVRGGSPEVAIWQVRPLVDVVLFYLLFDLTLRGPADFALLARVVVAAAVIKAALAWYIIRIIQPMILPDRPDHWEYATNHWDSMLFAVAVIILVAHWAERTDRKRTQIAMLVLPVILLGTRANNRRLAWVEMTLGFMALLAVTRTRPWKRFLARSVLLLAPVIVLYVAVGWNRTEESVFGPVRLVKSMTDSSFNRSTWCRHVEDWNLAMSIAERPILGRGFGHEWTEYYVGDDITGFFPMYKAEPHNMVLGLTLFAGAIGVAFLFMPFAAAVFLAARSYPRGRTPEERAAALVIIGAVLAILAQTFGDLGPFSSQFRLMTPLTLVLAGKLAGACGAWPTPPPRDS